MDVTITTKRCTVPEPVQEHTRRRVGRLKRFHPRATSATVSFDEDSRRRRCEVRLLVDGGPPLFARFDDSSWRNALNGAVDRLERQLKRQRQRRIRRRNDGATIRAGL